MKKYIYIIAIALFGLVACKGNENKENSSEGTEMATDSSSTQESVYTCPMHPEVVSDKPGTCPDCGMDLEIKS